MENKNLKHTQQVQKGLKTLDAKTRDRGDILKKIDGGKLKQTEKGSFKDVSKPVITDRGDRINAVAIAPKTTLNNNKLIKVNVSNSNKKLFEAKSKVTSKVLAEVVTESEQTNCKTRETINAANKIKVDEKRFLGDKVTSRAKVWNNQQVNKDFKSQEKQDLGNARVRNQQLTVTSNTTSDSKDIITDTMKSEVKTDSELTKKEKVDNRRPLVKTVKSKNDKVYKAVTFTEKKIVKPTVLEISIPNIQAKKTKTKLVDKNLEVKIPTVTTINNNKSTSELSVKEKIQHHHRNRVTQRTKRKKLNRCISSPDKFKKVESPPTEVAKWAPSCINAHTKPYYEAWVNTTLAAISKISKKDKLFLEKQSIIKQFQKSLETRADSPELVHEDYNNELFTGKIKIKHRRSLKGLKPKRQPLITSLLDKDFSI